MRITLGTTSTYWQSFPSSLTLVCSYYNAYLDYFHRVVLEPGATISTILEKYLFSSEYNVRTPWQDAEQPQMLNRFLEILIHPIIHVGYGAEFGILGLIAEGTWSETPG